MLLVSGEGLLHSCISSNNGNKLMVSYSRKPSRKSYLLQQRSILKCAEQYAEQEYKKIVSMEHIGQRTHDLKLYSLAKL